MLRATSEIVQGDAPADGESRAGALKVMRGAMALLTMVAAVLPDAAVDHLDVILQVLHQCIVIFPSVPQQDV